MWSPTKKLGPMGSAVLTFIDYKQTNKQTDKLNLYIDIYIDVELYINRVSETIIFFLYFYYVKMFRNT